MSNTVIEIGPDLNWNPAPFELPSVFLDGSTYKPPEAERDKWRDVRRLLPEGRQARIERCGTFALHLVKETQHGAFETVNPVSCSDRVACPYCAGRYAEELAIDRYGKLGALAGRHGVPLAYVEARATVPAWNEAVRASGCAKAEDRGKLCEPCSGCRTCALARPYHARAASIETELQTGLARAWSRLSPGTGGVYVTSIEQAGPYAPIQLVVRLLVPMIAVNLESGEIAEYEQPTIDALRDAWQKIAEAAGAVDVSIIGRGLTGEHIARAIMTSHLPAIEAFRRHAGVLTADVVLAFARAAGLATVTKAGRTRRAQRTAWFGVLAGRTQALALAILGFQPCEVEKHARLVILDSYKILDVSGEAVSVQSTRSGARKVLPTSMCRLSAYVDNRGIPSLLGEPTTWEHTPGLKFGARMAAYVRLVSGGGGINIAPWAKLQSPSQVRSAQFLLNGTLKLSAKKVWGKRGDAAMRIWL